MLIRVITIEDIEKIEALFRAVYNREQGLAYWRWCFEAPYGYIAVGMFDGDKLISYYASVLLEEGAITYSSMTHPEYRKKGYYQEVALKLYNELAKHRDWCCFYANKNIRELHFKMGNIEAGQVREYRIPLSSVDIPFIHWRFETHPLKNYFDMEGIKYNYYEDRVQIMDVMNEDKDIKYFSFWYEKELPFPYTLLPLWKMYRALKDDVDIFKIIKNDTVRMWQHDGF